MNSFEENKVFKNCWIEEMDIKDERIYSSLSTIDFLPRDTKANEVDSKIVKF